ncbi:MAG: protein translocase subunit SecF [Acidimicrobiia bacterium]
MSGWQRLVRGESTIDFVGLRRRWLAISVVMVTVSLLSLAIFRLDLGLEFRGGIAVQSPNPAGATVADFRAAGVGAGEVRIQLVDNGAAVRLQTGPLPPEEEERLVQAVADASGSSFEEASVEAVGPTFGATIARRALLALVVFLGAVALFITWRLEWKMALAGLAALFHDLILTLGVYSVTRLEVTPATVVAVLTILGYSLYDTVVVFDRVTEETTGIGMTSNRTYGEIANDALNHVLVRSLSTSVTSLLPVGSLLFVGGGVLGADTLSDLALALFVGMGVGTYSSIFVATPLLVWLKEREPRLAELKENLQARRGAKDPRSGRPSR